MLSYRLRHRINVQQLIETTDPITGALTRTWETILFNVPAEVLTGPGREFVQSGATQGELAARINTRWFPGLTQKMRIEWDGTMFNIISIETDATARREYRIKCKAGVSDGQ